MIIESPKLKESEEYYSKLGFTSSVIDGYTYVTDGKALIRLSPVNDARLGIIIFRRSLSDLKEKLKQKINIIEAGNALVFTEPSGTRVTITDKDLPSVSDIGASQALTGNCAGIGIESTDFDSSVEIWKLLGFRITMGAQDTGWVVLSDDSGSAISIMKYGSCPHLFFNPSFTYFNGKNNMAVIENIRKANIEIAQEITVFNKEGIVDNIILKDPAGVGFFIFSD